jgi:hypothetical protein
MKIKIVFSAFILCISPLLAQNVTSHTFFSVRPLFQSGSPELFTLFHNACDSNIDCHPGAFQAVLFGSKTTHKKECNPLATYFFPFNKSALLTGENGSDVVQSGQADVIANYFGVLTANPLVGPQEYNFFNGSFVSGIRINPEQSVWGIGLAYRQYIGTTCNPWWVAANAPLMQVKNRLNFCEQIINPGSGDIQPGYVGSITQALLGQTVFGNKAFQFGKIAPNNCLTKTGIGDIELKLGYTFAHECACCIDGYVGVVIPSGNKPKGEYIFEPIVGNNHHFGFIAGTEYTACLYTNANDTRLELIGAVDSRYLLSNVQCRSFDIVDKQWSRYMWLYPNDKAVSITDITPGINLLTQPLRIQPRFSVTANIELAITGNCWSGELGVNIYARQAEKASFAHCWPNTPGIVGINPLDRNALHTKSNATIRRYAQISGFIANDLDPAYVPITACDINLQSATHPAFITHTVYGSLGYQYDTCNYPFFIGLGSSYEFSDDNSGINRWTVWGKTGISF